AALGGKVEIAIAPPPWRWYTFHCNDRSNLPCFVRGFFVCDKNHDAAAFGARRNQSGMSRPSSFRGGASIGLPKETNANRRHVCDGSALLPCGSVSVDAESKSRRESNRPFSARKSARAMSTAAETARSLPSSLRS